MRRSTAMHDTSTSKWIEAPHAVACVAITLWFIACELLIWPSANVPIIDDWTYAWSVDHLLDTGQLRILPISAVYPLTQVLWGALFTLPGGFSFTALRISTLVLACAGVLAFYGTLIELGIERRRALIGTFCVACNPVNLLLANTFMTDVPLVSVSSLATLAYVRGITRRSAVSLWLAAGLSVAAVLIRQVAIVVPFAAAGACLLTRERDLRRFAAVPVSCACLAVLGVWAASGWAFGPSAQQAERLEKLQYLTKPGWSGYARAAIQMIVTLSFMLLPLVLASLQLRRPKVIAATLACFAITFAVPVDLLDPDHATLNLYELGGARNLIAGQPERPQIWSTFALLAIALAGMGVTAALAAVATAPRADLMRQVSRPAFRFIVGVAILHGLLTNLFWLYCDRYYLAFVPALVACLLLVIPSERLNARLASVLLAAQTVIGILGTRDSLRYNERCAVAYAELVRSGIRPYDIDAGWSFNGWMLYANDANLPRDWDRERDVQSVTAKRATPYLFAKAPVPGYEPIAHERWRGFLWPWPNELYVLRKVDPLAQGLTRGDSAKP